MQRQEPCAIEMFLGSVDAPFLRPGQNSKSAARSVSQGRAQRAREAGCLD
jgi:hypothetical protein